MSAVVSRITRRRSSVLAVFGSSQILGPLLALVLAIVVFSTQSDKFLSGSNFSLILQQVMVVGTLAIGQTLIILTAGIDLSCSMIMSLATVFMTGFAMRMGWDPVLAIFVGLLVGAAFGLLNGWLVTAIRLPPFIVTLGTFSIAYAMVHIYTSETINNLPNVQTFLGNTFSIGGTDVTYGSVVMLGLYVVVWFVLRSTAAGRAVYAVGDNPEAARLAGINTNRVLLGVYATAGLFYALAGLLLVARTGVGDPNAGGASTQDNLATITAVVLGGTSLFGGRGLIFGTLIGALIVGVFRNGLQLMGVESNYQVLITGVLVILAVAVDALSHRRQ
jgi:fructose transport system permease protein